VTVAVVALPLRGWQRVAIVALLTVPLLLVVVAMLVPLAMSMFLGKDRQDYALKVVSQLIRWVRVIAGSLTHG
jgi:hypothetical protein